MDRTTKKRTTVKIFLEGLEDPNEFEKEGKRLLDAKPTVIYKAKYKDFEISYLHDNRERQFIDALVKDGVNIEVTSREVETNWVDIRLGDDLFTAWFTHLDDNNKPYAVINVETPEPSMHKERVLTLLRYLNEKGFKCCYDCKEIVTETKECRSGEF